LDTLLQDIANNDAERLLKDHHTVLIDFNESIEMNSYPITLTTIINNLINNSLTHVLLITWLVILPWLSVIAKHSETNSIFIQYNDNGTQYGGSIRCEVGGDDNEDEKVAHTSIYRYLKVNDLRYILPTC